MVFRWMPSFGYGCHSFRLQRSYPVYLREKSLYCLDTWRAGSGGHFKSHHSHPESADIVLELDGVSVPAQTHGILGQTVRDIVYTDKKDQEQYLMTIADP
jgi:hypothetical protein